MWKDVNRLKDAFELLPEPVMIVGNRVPDGDSLGSCAAVLDALRDLAIESYIYCAVPPDKAISWMLEEGDTHDTILEDYESLIVLDDLVDSSRLGFQIKEDIPIVCVDHHMGNFPDDRREAIIASSEITVYSVDKTLFFHAVLPATACLLIDENIFHPYLWPSIYTDTVGLTVNTREAVAYTNRLISVLNLSNAEIESMNDKINQIATLSDLQDFWNSSLYMISGLVEGKEQSMIVCITPAKTNIAFYNMLATLRRFADIVVFINSNNGKASLRSRTYDFNVLNVAKEFGGGGHLRAAGITLDASNLLSEVDRLIESLVSKMESPRTRWVV